MILFEFVRIEGEGLEVRVLVVPEVDPGLAAVVRAEHPARADAVVELATRIDDVRVIGCGLDDVVVEALPAAVVLDVVRASSPSPAGSIAQLAPAFVDLKTRDGW